MITNLFLGSTLGVLVSSFFVCIFSINLVKLDQEILIKFSQRKIFSSAIFVIIFILCINLIFMIFGLLLSIIYMVFFDNVDRYLILSSNLYFTCFIIILNLLFLFPSIYIFKNFRFSFIIFSFPFIIIFGWIMPFFISL